MHTEQSTDGTWVAYGDPVAGEVGYGATEQEAMDDLRAQRRAERDERARLDADERLVRRIVGEQE